jgi:hypothetical protein
MKHLKTNQINELKTLIFLEVVEFSEKGCNISLSVLPTKIRVSSLMFYGDSVVV